MLKRLVIINGTFKINEVSSAYNFTVLSIDCIFAKEELKANSGVNFQTFIDQHAKINNFKKVSSFFQDEHDVLYNKTYADLTSKIAYRHPNPGVPR